MLIPGWLLTETVTVEPYAGLSAGAPSFGTAVSVRAQVQPVSTQPARSGITANTSAAGVAMTVQVFDVWTRPGITVPVGSRVTCRDIVTTAIEVEDNSAPGMPGPRHLALKCQRAQFIPTTTVTIRRGTPVENAYGDLVDASTTTATGLDAAVVETTQRASHPVDQRGGVVETYAVRLRAGVDVREHDRIVDDATGRIYRVLDVTIPNPATGPQLGTDDIITTCRRVAATSSPNT